MTGKKGSSASSTNAPTVSPWDSKTYITQSYHFPDHDKFRTKLSVHGHDLKRAHDKHDDIQGKDYPGSFIG